MEIVLSSSLMSVLIIGGYALLCPRPRSRREGGIIKWALMSVRPSVYRVPRPDIIV